MAGIHEVAGSSDSKNYIAKWCQFILFSAPHIIKCSFSLTRQSYGDSLPNVCLAGQVGAIYRPPEHPWMPDRPMNEASMKVHC